MDAWGRQILPATIPRLGCIEIQQLKNQINEFKLDVLEKLLVSKIHIANLSSDPISVAMKIALR